MRITTITLTTDGGSCFGEEIELTDAGEIEVEVTSGEKRRFRGGDVVLVEDTTGTGHRTRTVDGRPRRSLFVPLAGSGWNT